LAQFQRLGRFMGMARQLTQTQTSNLSNMLSFWTTTPKTQHQNRFFVIYSNKREQPSTSTYRSVVEKYAVSAVSASGTAMLSGEGTVVGERVGEGEIVGSNRACLSGGRARLATLYDVADQTGKRTTAADTAN